MKILLYLMINVLVFCSTDNYHLIQKYPFKDFISKFCDCFADNKKGDDLRNKKGDDLRAYYINLSKNIGGTIQDIEKLLRRIDNFYREGYYTKFSDDGVITFCSRYEYNLKSGDCIERKDYDPVDGFRVVFSKILDKDKSNFDVTNISTNNSEKSDQIFRFADSWFNETQQSMITNKNFVHNSEIGYLNFNWLRFDPNKIYFGDVEESLGAYLYEYYNSLFNIRNNYFDQYDDMSGYNTIKCMLNRYFEKVFESEDFAVSEQIFKYISAPFELSLPDPTDPSVVQNLETISDIVMEIVDYKTLLVTVKDILDRYYLQNKNTKIPNKRIFSEVMTNLVLWNFLREKRLTVNNLYGNNY